MNFKLKKPCWNCPFKKVGPIPLRVGRLKEIVADLASDDSHWFICHKTLCPPHTEESQCVGAMVYLMKVKRPSISMRMAFSVGILNPDDLVKQFDTIVDPL